MTKPLYYDDSYLKEFSATVTAVNKNDEGKAVFIELDQTVFYPNGGGQPSDVGVLDKDGMTYAVGFVGNFDGKISHCVDKEGLAVGDTVSGKIDWEHRYKLMRMHTACHVISSVFTKDHGVKLTGGQLGVEKSRIDINIEEFDREKIQQYIDESNVALATNQDTESSYISREEAEQRPELAKLAKGLKEGLCKLRILKIGNIDEQADGGTHVKNTSEVGKVVLLKCENKGKSNRRVHFGLE